MIVCHLLNESRFAYCRVTYHKYSRDIFIDSLLRVAFLINLYLLTGPLLFFLLLSRFFPCLPGHLFLSGLPLSLLFSSFLLQLLLRHLLLNLSFHFIHLLLGLLLCWGRLFQHQVFLIIAQTYNGLLSRWLDYLWCLLSWYVCDSLWLLLLSNLGGHWLSWWLTQHPVLILICLLGFLDRLSLR